MFYDTPPRLKQFMENRPSSTLGAASSLGEDNNDSCLHVEPSSSMIHELSDDEIFQQAGNVGAQSSVVQDLLANEKTRQCMRDALESSGLKAFLSKKQRLSPFLLD